MPKVAELCQVGVRSGRTQVLHEMNLSVPAGALYALVGPSGAGKTTTLKVLLGLQRAQQGESRVLGEDSRHIERLAGRVGALLDRLGLETRMTLRQNLRLAALRAGRRPTEEGDLLDALELSQLADRKVGRLSQGERQRLALVAALSLRPDLLVLDEPLVHLDPLSLTRVMDCLREHQARCGMTILLSSHHLAEVERSATHLALIHGGRVLREAPLAEMLGAAARLVVVASPAGPAEACIRAQTFVEECIHRGGAPPLAEFDVLLREDGAARLNAALHAAGVAVHQLARRRPTLEEVFHAALPPDARESA